MAQHDRSRAETQKGHIHAHRPAGSKIKKRFGTAAQWNAWKYKWDFYHRFHRFPKED